MRLPIAIILSVLATHAYAAPKAEVTVLLSGFEYVPTNEDLLRGRTRSELEETLVALSADASRPMFVRARATSLLGRFPSAITRARLEEILDGGAEHPSLLMAAVRAASSFGAALSVRLHPYLAHADVHLREVAVASLALAGDRPALEARLVEEESPLIRARIADALSAR
jgi:hypothetical protein